MPVSNFLIIGAQKSGTTSLYHYLAEHPDIYMSPVKEPFFFSPFVEGERGVDPPIPGAARFLAAHAQACTHGWESYCRLFDGVRHETAIGEATPVYLANPKSPERIKHRIPKARLIAILRHPADRAYSGFCHMLEAKLETTSDFAKALEDEPRRLAENWVDFWTYRRQGFYFEHLSRYLEVFDRRQMRIHLYDDLVADPEGLVRDVYTFLGVDESFVPDLSQRHNPTRLPKNRLLDSLMTRESATKRLAKRLLPAQLLKRVAGKIRERNLEKPHLDPQLRAELIQFYRSDILRLQDLLNRDLGHWLENESSRP